jgi:hypothetical protein
MWSVKLCLHHGIDAYKGLINGYQNLKNEYDVVFCNLVQNYLAVWKY